MSETNCGSLFLIIATGTYSGNTGSEMRKHPGKDAGSLQSNMYTQSHSFIPQPQFLVWSVHLPVYFRVLENPEESHMDMRRTCETPHKQ